MTNDLMGDHPGAPDGDALAVTETSRLRRFPERGSHSRADLYGVLDAGWICHLGLVVDGRPLVVPTTYGRSGDRLYVHGSVASRSLRSGRREPVCVTVTHVDGLVLARSLFEHSVNYRSAMVHGQARVVADADKLAALQVLSEHIAPGQWDYARHPSDREMAQTTILTLGLDEASVKVRSGPPEDGDGPDAVLPVWAGTIPVGYSAGAPVADPTLDPGVPQPAHIDALARNLGGRMAPPAT